MVIRCQTDALGMAMPLLWCALLAMAAVAGCAAPDGDPDAVGDGGASSTSDTRRTSTGLPDRVRVAVDGTLEPLGAGFVANVSAYNPGPETYGVGRAYCVSGYGAWSARMSGPPGDDLAYADPDANQLGCAGQTGIPMPPGSYWNWTFVGDWPKGRCDTRHVCDNWWDGNLTLDGERVRAPPGDYTWRFTFAYSVGTSGGPTGIERESVEFEVLVPPGA